MHRNLQLFYTLILKNHYLVAQDEKENGLKVVFWALDRHQKVRSYVFFIDQTYGVRLQRVNYRDLSDMRDIYDS